MADEFSDRDRKLFDDTVAVGRLTHMPHCGQKPTAAVLRTARSPTTLPQQQKQFKARSHARNQWGAGSYRTLRGKDNA